jgi:hypothetical protein
MALAGQIKARGVTKHVEMHQKIEPCRPHPAPPACAPRDPRAGRRVRKRTDRVNRENRAGAGGAITALFRLSHASFPGVLTLMFSNREKCLRSKV